MKKIEITLLITAVATTSLGLLAFAIRDARSAVVATENHPTSLTIDYPLNGSVFPPEITPPTFLWRDPAEAPVIGGSKSGLPTVQPQCVSIPSAPV